MTEYSNDIANYIDILRAYASRAAFVLEIGPAKGNGSTLAFTEGLELNDKAKVQKLFISVDIRDYMEIKPNLSYWKLLIGDSREEETRKQFRAITKRFPDILFIDTHHTYEQMKRELEVWSPIASPVATTWLFHDTYMMGEYNHMTDAIKEFAKDSPWNYVDISSEAHGLGALVPRKGVK